MAETRLTWRLSMRLAEQRRKGDSKDLVVEIIADAQDPVAPVFRAGAHDERPNDAGGVVTRLGQIPHGGAILLEHAASGIGAMEIDMSQEFRLPRGRIQTHR